MNRINASQSNTQVLREFEAVMDFLARHDLAVTQNKEVYCGNAMGGGSENLQGIAPGNSRRAARTAEFE
jgi:hypothetical protein